MIRILLVSLAVALATLANAAPEVVRDARHSAVSLTTAPSDVDGRRYCSGAVVQLEQGPRVITAGHCVSEAGERVYLRDIRGNFYTATVESMEFDWPEDYAVLTSAAQWLLPALEVGGPMVIGDTYYSWASPHGYKLLFFRGMYAGITMPNFDQRGGDLSTTGMPWLAIDGAGGSSGSVVLDSEGRAVAIHVGGLGTRAAPPGYNVSIPLRGGLLAPLPS